MTVIANFNLEIDEVEIVDGILVDLQQYLSGIFNKINFEILTKIKEIIIEELKKSPEYFSMQVGGELFNQIGNINLPKDVDKIIQEVADSVVYKVDQPKIIGREIQGGFEVIIDSRNFFEILYSPEASYSRNGHDLPWLRWLLLEGDSGIVIGYIYNPNTGLGTSTTHSGIMTKSSSESWKIPSEFQGTETNNWITRSLSRIENELYVTIEREFTVILNA